MGRYLVPFAMVSAMVAFAISALTVAAVPDHPAWWRGAVTLAVLGGIVPMIYAVNIRIVPVFSRRALQSLAMLRAQVITAIAGAWITFAGRLAESDGTQTTGHVLALVGGFLFVTNIMRLFRQPPGATPALPLPYPGQAQVDKIAIRFTRMSGLYLLAGLVVGIVTAVDPPRTGRWDLVWAHALLVGFFLTMASGVSYHVLARWTTRRWRSIRLIRLHFWLVAAGLPLMLAGLMLDQNWLFHAAGPIQAAALLLFLLNTFPLALGLPAISRIAWPLAMAMLTTGVTLGALFAGMPVLGARLRLAHAEINLWGWSGLLIASAGYYLVPRFAGRPLFWPRLAPIQVGLLTTGVLLGSVLLGLRGYGHDPGNWLILPQAMISASFFALGVILAGTFLLAKPGVAVAISPRRPIPVTRSPQRPS